MGRPLKDTQTATVTTDTSRWAKLTGKVCTLGPTERSMTVSGSKDSSKGMVFGGACTTTPILENGLNQKHTVTGFTPGRMETVMKVNGTWLSSMELEPTFS